MISWIGNWVIFLTLFRHVLLLFFVFPYRMYKLQFGMNVETKENIFIGNDWNWVGKVRKFMWQRDWNLWKIKVFSLFSLNFGFLLIVFHRFDNHSSFALCTMDFPFLMIAFPLFTIIYPLSQLFSPPWDKSLFKHMFPLFKNRFPLWTIFSPWFWTITLILSFHCLLWLHEKLFSLVPKWTPKIPTQKNTR